MDCVRAQRGVGMVEALIGLPVVCLLGLATLQIALLMHAGDALHVALLQAARAGSVAHAERGAIERGLARGLEPLMPPTAAGAAPELARMRALQTLRAGLAEGWIRLRRLSPTRQSFVDWGTPARDAAGAPLDGTEIAVDNLPSESARRQPASGVSGLRASAPIGQASGQTLADASLLRLELVYGVPVSVPLAGPMIEWALRIADKCTLPTGRRLGAVDLGRPARELQARGWVCAFYGAQDASSASRPRVPVRLTLLVRMQTPPRLDPATPSRAALASGAR